MAEERNLLCIPEPPIPRVMVAPFLPSLTWIRRGVFTQKRFPLLTCMTSEQNNQGHSATQIVLAEPPSQNLAPCLSSPSLPPYELNPWFLARGSTLPRLCSCLSAQAITATVWHEDQTCDFPLRSFYLQCQIHRSWATRFLVIYRPLPAD